MRTYCYVNTLYNSYSNFDMYVPFVKNVKDCLKFVLDNLTTQFHFLVLACCLTSSHSDSVPCCCCAIV